MTDAVIIRNWLPERIRMALLAIAKDPATKWGKRRSGNYHGSPLRKLPESCLDFPPILPTEERKLTLLRVLEGKGLIRHKDNTKHMVLQRIVMLQPADEGGILHVEDNPYPLGARDSCTFDANAQIHYVSKVTRGTRYALAVSYFELPPKPRKPI